MTHTWDIHLYYHRCPSCGFIQENRQPFHYESGQYVKELTCKRCGHEFIEKQDREVRIGPFFGDDAKPEVDWE